MRVLTIWLICLACAATGFNSPLYPQTSRDSAGVLIVENVRPTWSDSERLRLAAEPQLIIGNRADSAYLFRQVAAVMKLSDGRIAVVDGGSVELRLFSPQGQFLTRSAVQGMVRGQNFNLEWVRRLDGDTIAIETSFATVGLYSNTGEFVRTIALPPWVESSPFQRPRLVTLFNSGLGIIGPGPEASTPHPVGSRWTDSVRLQLVTPSSDVRRELGTFAAFEMAQTTDGESPVWLAPYGFFAGSNDRFYAGFGDRFEFRVYGADGKLQSIIRRAWTPMPITDDDWEHWVVEWSKLWVTTTGAERERDVQAVRESPWAEQNPAFSWFIIDEIGRLWVRDAHWQDAIGAGSLADRPVVPSTWSVFDTRGRWLGDVGMPVGLQVFDIGADYVTGTRRIDGVTQVVVYGLGTGGP